MIRMFKLFGDLLNNPDIFTVLVFLFVVIIIILLKIDGLEKNLRECINKILDIENRIKVLESDKDELSEKEQDIIDKFLMKNGFNINNKDTNKRIRPDEVLRDEDISPILNPREDTK